MKYRNLDLQTFDYQVVEGVERFRVRASGLPAGEEPETQDVSLPPGLRQRLQQLVERRLDLAEMITLGEDLAALLLPPRARAFLIHSRERLKEDEGLRIRLRLDTQADLPWEYVYVPHPVAPPEGPEALVTDEAREQKALQRKHLVKLRQILTEGFDRDELITFCYDLGVDYDDLPAQGKTHKVRALIAHLERRDRIPELIEIGKQQRPDIAWDKALQALKETTSTLSDALPRRLSTHKGPEGFLALDRRISLVRYQALGEPADTLSPVDVSPLRLAALLACPDESGYLGWEPDIEHDKLRQALKDVPGIHAEFYPDATLKTVEEALLRETHIFHFAGHGEFADDPADKSAIVLLDDDRRAMLFPAEKLALNLAGRGVRLAVLETGATDRHKRANAWTSVAPALIRAGIPAVIGMQYTVRDANAIVFNRRLYRALAAGQSIEAAVVDGRLSIFNRGGDGERDWGVSVLYMRSDQGVLFPRPQIVAKAPAVLSAQSPGEERELWDKVLARSQEQTERFLKEAQDLDFSTRVYVRRVAIEDKVDAFLKSDAVALLIIGNPGVGKTTLLRRWALDLLAESHGVFFYNCGGSMGLDIEREIARDLSVHGPDELLSALEHVGELAGRAGRRFVLIFDAVNEFRGGNSAGPKTLLKRIDALVSRLPAQNALVVLACGAPAWRQLERLDAADLFWSRYFQVAARAESPEVSESFLHLDLFSPQEFETAYERYREFFQLQTPLAELSAVLCERLRDPLLLRMLAETYQGRDESISYEALSLNIFQRYYEERVRRRRDQLFVAELAAEMLRQRRSALPVDDLMRNEQLRPEILSDESDSSFNQLLDAGILTEVSGDLSVGDMIKFTHDRVGGYALARYLQRRSNINNSIISALVHEAQKFPLAWDVAWNLLLLCKDPVIFAELAQSTSIELRELVVESLAALYADEPSTTVDLITQLLKTDSGEAQRTGLKAAYLIGPGARDVFLWAAIKGTPALRQVTKDTLYLTWRTDPDFTYSLLDELATRIGLGALRDLRNILEFIIELSITIYINHCERDDVVQHTDELWYKVLTDRLHMDLLHTGILGPAFEKLIFQAVASAFTKRLLDTALFSELIPADRFFDLQAEDKTRFKHVVTLVDPQADLRPAMGDLATLIQSDIVLFNILASLVLAIHAYHDFEATEPLLWSLFEELNAHGRLWELLGFAVLLPDTPPAWTELVEELTRCLVEEHPATFYGEEAGFLAQFDIVLMPLGLAYGKRRDPNMPYFETLIRDGLSQSDQRQVNRCLAGLGPVGFYYPEAVFHTLRAAIPDFEDPDLQTALIRPLATIRTLHLDAVDTFLRQIGADDAFQRRVSAEADVELVRRYIYMLGIYNNAVHQALFYPKMRRQILMGGLNALADARRPRDFIANYTPVPIRMTREAGYRLRGWTLPE